MSGLNSSLTRDYDVYGRLSRTSVSGASGFDVVYDDRGEVAAATVAGRSETHAYDFIGNEFISNCLNQPTEDTDCGNVAYDDCGRLITHSVADASPTLVLTYDAMHRLETASAVEADVTLVQSNVYDNVGRRVMKYALDGVHRYYYDDWLLRLETISIADGLVTIEYVWGKDISGSLGGAAGIGGLLYTKINGAIYVPQYDAYGNVIGYCDAAGNIVASYTYDAFGRTISQSGALADVFAFRYSTKYFDRETGFYYYGKRYYSPALRRWLTRDPIEEDGGVNLYEYCGNAATFSMDKIGNARMITGALNLRHGRFVFNGEVYARQILRFVEELNGRKDSEGKSLFDAKVSDFVSTPLSEIKEQVEKSPEDTYFVSHGAVRKNGRIILGVYKWGWFDDAEEGFTPDGPRGSRFVTLQELGSKIQSLNLYGCYISPYLRRINGISRKDDYSIMLNALLTRLKQMYEHGHKPCLRTIRIYEGENSGSMESTKDMLDKYPIREESFYERWLEGERKLIGG